MDALFVDYDDLLIGRTDQLNIDNFFTTEEGEINERRAVACIKYILEDLMKLDPDVAIKQFDSYMIRKLKLEQLVNKINFPVDVPYGYPRYILSLIYPDKVHINRKRTAELIYRQVLDSTSDTKIRQFPREYFLGESGIRRYATCISYLLETYKPIYSIDELYAFLLSADGKRFLNSHRLKTPADQFSIDICDAIKCMTEDDPHCNLFYSYYTFLNLSKAK